MTNPNPSGLDQSAFSSLADDWRVPTLFKCTLTIFFVIHFVATVSLTPGLPVIDEVRRWFAIVAVQTAVYTLGMRGIFKPDAAFIKYFVIALLYLMMMETIIAALSFVTFEYLYGSVLLVYAVLQFILLILTLVFRNEPAPKFMLYLWPFRDAGINKHPLESPKYNDDAISTVFTNNKSKANTFTLRTPTKSTSSSDMIQNKDSSAVWSAGETISNPLTRVPSMENMATGEERTPTSKCSKSTASNCRCVDCVANCSVCKEHNLHSSTGSDMNTAQEKSNSTMTLNDGIGGLNGMGSTVNDGIGMPSNTGSQTGSMITADEGRSNSSTTTQGDGRQKESMTTQGNREGRQNGSSTIQNGTAGQDRGRLDNNNRVFEFKDRNASGSGKGSAARNSTRPAQGGELGQKANASEENRISKESGQKARKDGGISGQNEDPNSPNPNSTPTNTLKATSPRRIQSSEKGPIRQKQTKGKDNEMRKIKVKATLAIPKQDGPQ
ncbi:unnamed protein product [Bursaphelenchus okinawaensis]|uniref:Uncharacterized protein n=1 Tax=Bursaphelenchus okinawaensis TaxID=465554 RepID=A0A811L870_9BILA|nr:unnamed protein product [Bursaphelenchus okinawaensis]CAG9120925.1 unnamed protein product [Bursaphelenchus okinawaensis]